MAKKSLGYVELEWTCPNCGARNPGDVRICAQCGAPQPEDVQFEQAAEEKIITDAAVISKAKAGADIHCAYCGTRNPATATTCSQCGADLREGKAREKGQVLGAYRDAPAPEVKCPYCGAMNPATALNCANCGATLPRPESEAKPERPAPVPQRSRPAWLWLAIGGALIVFCFAALYLVFGRTDDVTAQVVDRNWERQVAILGLVAVQYEDWRDQIPEDAEIETCNDEVRYVSDVFKPNSVEVCGTPYTVDQGSGFGEVVQDCEYQVYDSYCSFTVMELGLVDTAVATGNDLNPQWPQPELAADQQLGERGESYAIRFRADGETFTYQTDDPAEYARFEIGSNWTLKVNTLNAVVSAEPAP